MFCLLDVNVVLPKEFSKFRNSNTLSSSLSPPEYDTCSRTLIGVLNRIRHPRHDIVVNILTTLSHILPDVVEVQRAIPFLWFYRESFPKIITVWKVLIWSKNNPLVFPASGMLKPIVAE